ncbi:MAG: 4'-phosphopantetheinyl transferase superfamily protein [Lachnospiraceae bacterium]|nr:4'-phosphopantetheinyl transferase superfamily protein [Lachnospiraceae bacterium]
MIYTYYIDVTQFDNETLFQEKLKLLSPYRQQKIALLKHAKDRNRSLGAGIALDHALETYGLKERSVEYEFGEWGKPSLKYQPNIYFSLSHSGDYAICSIGDREIGNDIELIKHGRLKVADRFFAKEELEWMYAVQDEEEITQRMFRIWTMKESFLKATGKGISLPLGDFAVIVDEDKDKIRVKHSYNAKFYHMKEYADIDGYRVAVCCEEGRDVAYSMMPIVF